MLHYYTTSEINDFLFLLFPFTSEMVSLNRQRCLTFLQFSKPLTSTTTTKSNQVNLLSSSFQEFAWPLKQIPKQQELWGKKMQASIFQCKQSSVPQSKSYTTLTWLQHYISSTSFYSIEKSSPGTSVYPYQPSYFPSFPLRVNLNLQNTRVKGVVFLTQSTQNLARLGRP